MLHPFEQPIDIQLTDNHFHLDDALLVLDRRAVVAPASPALLLLLDSS